MLRLAVICRFLVFSCFILPQHVWAEASVLVEDSTQPNIASSEAALSVNEPMYFVVGGESGGDIKARFQFSFKYRVFDDDSRFIDKYNWLSGFHFSYTQRSLWNLSIDSQPFEDSSYRPGFFLDFKTSSGDYSPGFIRAGFEHESNGRANRVSRSVNTVFVWPFWTTQWHDQELLIGPKFYSYLSTGINNQDIDEYRGYADFWLSYGNEDNWLLTTILRHGSENRNMIQLDITYPVRKKIFSRTAGYIYMQIFNGYGESLLTYNVRQDTQFRIGFAIVR